jgi:hypothetical protein
MTHFVFLRKIGTAYLIVPTFIIFVEIKNNLNILRTWVHSKQPEIKITVTGIKELVTGILQQAIKIKKPPFVEIRIRIRIRIRCVGCITVRMNSITVLNEMIILPTNGSEL